MGKISPLGVLRSFGPIPRVLERARLNEKGRAGEGKAGRGDKLGGNNCHCEQVCCVKVYVQRGVIAPFIHRESRVSKSYILT